MSERCIVHSKRVLYAQVPGAEPTFDELDPVNFFARFSQGVYEIEARTVGGRELESETLLTHIIPEPPAPTVNGIPMALECDDEIPGYDATEIAADSVTIARPPVT